MLTLSQKGSHSMSPATDSGYQTFAVCLTVASDRVFGWYRPRNPGLNGDFERCSTAVWR